MKFRRLEIRRRIKEKAKRLLTKYLSPALKICLLLTAIYSVVEYIRLYAAPVLEVKGDGIAALVNAYLTMSWQALLSILAINLLAILVVGPLLCCFCGFFITVTSEKKPANNAAVTAEPEEIAPKMSESLRWFYSSKIRNKAILLRLTYSLLSVFWQILCCAPPIYFLYHLRGNPNSIYYANSMMVYLTWLLVGYLLAYVKTGTYYPAFFLIAQNPDMPILSAIRDSARMMKGHAWEFFTYKLSFAPWYLVAIGTFGLGLLYIVPLRGISDSLFIRYIDAVSSGEDPF